MAQRSDFCKGIHARRKKRLSARGSNGDRVLRTKQGAVSGAALRFLQGHSCPPQKTAKRKRFKRRPRPADETGSREWRSETERAKERTLPCRKFWSLAVRGRARAPLPAACGISPACPCTTWTGSGTKPTAPTSPGRNLTGCWRNGWRGRPGSSTATTAAPCPCGWPPATRCFSWTTPPKSAWTPSPTGWARCGRICLG